MYFQYFSTRNMYQYVVILGDIVYFSMDKCILSFYESFFLGLCHVICSTPVLRFFFSILYKWQTKYTVLTSHSLCDAISLETYVNCSLLHAIDWRLWHKYYLYLYFHPISIWFLVFVVFHVVRHCITWVVGVDILKLDKLIRLGV